MAWQLYVLEFPNGKKYFGVTSGTLKRRWSAHKRAYGYGGRDRINIAINKHGDENIVARTLVIGEKDYIFDLEIKAIAAFQTRDPKYGYNVALGGIVGLTEVPEIAARAGLPKRGRPLSPEHCAKISAAHMGKTLSEDHKASVSRTLTGRTVSPESVAKRAAQLIGRSQTPEHVEKRAAKKRGTKHTPEALSKMSDAQKARGPRGTYTPEHCAAISKALIERFSVSPPSVAQMVTPQANAKRAATMRGRIRGPQSPELIEKRIAPLRGRKHSEEARAKMSDAAKRREERRRQKEQEIASQET